MEQQIGSKLGKEYIKTVYWHTVYLSYMQSSYVKCKLDEAQGGIKITEININNLRYAGDSTLMAENKE